MSLSVNNLQSFEKKPYCKTHLPTVKHTVVNDDVMTKHNTTTQGYKSQSMKETQSYRDNLTSQDTGGYGGGAPQMGMGVGGGQQQQGGQEPQQGEYQEQTGEYQEQNQDQNYQQNTGEYQEQNYQ